MRELQSTWRWASIYCHYGLVYRDGELKFVRKWLSQSGDELAQVFATDTDYIVRYLGVAEFAVSRTGKDVCVLHTLTDDSLNVSRVRDNQILPMAMALRGQLVIHASASDIGGRCAAFCGESGRGKSTLAMAFAHVGCAFLTDDGLRIEADREHYFGWPRAAQLGLRRPSYVHFSDLGAFSADMPMPADAQPKTTVNASDNIPHAPSKLPMAGLYFLGQRDVAGVMIQPLTRRTVIQQLLSNTFVLDTTDRVALASHFAQISALAAAVPCFELNYPRSFPMLDTVVATVREHVATLIASNIEHPIAASLRET